MKRILILTNNDLGLYKFRRELLEQLCKENEVTIVLPNGDFVKPLQEIGCNYIPIEFNRRGTNPISDFKLFCKYFGIIRQMKPFVVLTYTIKPNIYGGAVCRYLKTPCIANVTGLGTAVENGGLLSFLTKNLYKFGLKRTSCVFFQNKQNQTLFLQKGIVSGKTRLIPGSGVNLEQHCLEDYPADQVPVHFLFIGRIMKDKGIAELLEAAKIVKQRYPDTLIDVVGGCDEDYTAALKTAEEEGLIKYYGQQSEVHTFITNAHCTVLPSYHEGTANVMLESASTGRPVITTRVPGCRETFEEGVTGFGCDVQDSGSLADAMIRFIELPYQQKIQMGKEGRKKMEREFNRTIVIDSYMEEISQIQKI